MLYSLLLDKSVGFCIMCVSAFVLTFFAIKIFKGSLPKDQGKDLAINGKLSQGKPRGAGIILINVFVLCAVLFVPLKVESIINLVLIYAAMLTGYLDDAAKVPWEELKKGLMDLVIAVGVAVNFVIHHSTTIHFFNTSFEIAKPVYAVLAVILVLVSINVVNCSDGVDGLCASLSMVSILSFEVFNLKYKCGIIMFFVLLAYLWFNSSPSILLMGDAGSRAIGVFIALMAVKTGHPIAFIPLVFMMILDGGLGLIKLSVRRITKSQTFMDGIRTPIHDHARKNLGWSDTHVVIRFVILQIVISAFFISLLR